MPHLTEKELAQLTDKIRVWVQTDKDPRRFMFQLPRAEGEVPAGAHLMMELREGYPPSLMIAIDLPSGSRSAWSPPLEGWEV